MRRIVWSVLAGLPALLLSACAAATEPNTPASRQPSQWEYRVVTLDEQGERNLSALMAQYGMEGWEYVGQVNGKDDHLVFKRPISGRIIGYSTAATSVGTAVFIPGGMPRGSMRVETRRFGATSATRVYIPEKTEKVAPIPPPAVPPAPGPINGRD